MRMRIKLLVGAAAVVAAAIAGVVIATRGDATPPPDAPKSTFSVPQARAFGEFAVYNVGDAFEGDPLVAVLRQKTVDGGVDYVSFIYGDCVAGDDAGCAPPLEVQVWPACLRNPSVYADARAHGLTSEDTVVRGVPAQYFEDGSRLEVSTGSSTVVIFGADKGAVTRAADALRGVNNRVAVTQRLPEPAQGALSGRLRC